MTKEQLKVQLSKQPVTACKVKVNRIFQEFPLHMLSSFQRGNLGMLIIKC